MDYDGIVQLVLNSEKSSGTKRVYVGCARTLQLLGFDSSFDGQKTVDLINNCALSPSTKALLFRFLKNGLIPLGVFTESNNLIILESIKASTTANRLLSERIRDSIYTPIEEIKSKVNSIYKEGTMKHCLFTLLLETPLRDNCFLEIVRFPVEASSLQNVLYIDEQGDFWLHLNHTKTIPSKFPKKKILCSENLKKTFSIYLDKYPSSTIFSKSVACCVGKWMKKELKIEKGCLNYLRHVHAQSAKSPDEIVQFAERAGHSLKTALYYRGDLN